MESRSRARTRAGAVVVGLAMTALTGGFAVSAVAASASTGPRFVSLAGSVTPTTDTVTGGYQSQKMSIEVSLAPRNASSLNSVLKNLYNKNSSSYQKWLGKGQFDARFAPTAAAKAAVSHFLAGASLKVQPSGSPFLVRATGTSAQVSAAFHTTLRTFRDPRGIKYYSNSTAAQMPATLAPSVDGVVGLSNTIREHSSVTRIDNVMTPQHGKGTGPLTGCEAPYPTAAQLANVILNGVGFPFGFGGSPGCNGLTPSQTNSIYNAPHVGPRGKGAGVTLAVFELAAYQQSDIAAWAHQFYGPGYNPPLVDINVDGGPLGTFCPAGDTCVPGYNGDIEVDADIEMQLAMSPAAHAIEVYNAPNDYSGQTELDEYTQIANDDSAAVVSSSWSVCENDVSAGYVEAENTIFEQMAAQGQSMFGAAGDTGAFECVRSDGTTGVNSLDPPSQPWVTSVGGTSLESANPQTNPTPSYPKGVETVWNVDNLCNTSANEDSIPGIDWCALTGAGGGGSSQYWGRPFYQFGPGVNNPNTTYANGTTACSLAKTGTPCREVPDVSANADEYTPYAEYCTETTATAALGGNCAFPQTPAGWFGIGGTSLSSPLWSGIIADRDSYLGHRSGNINPLVYLLFNLAPNRYFHDITGKGSSQQAATNNGLFPTTPGYDEATGVGTPNMAALITGS
jgi:subtilase family serine protease